VGNPVHPGVAFTSSDRRRREVERLRDTLDEKIQCLDVLKRPDCTPKQAMGAWAELFNHAFWADAKDSLAKAGTADTGLTVDCWLAREKEGAVYKQHRSGSVVLPKGVHLRFTANPVGVAGPYSIRWAVRNEGHEAKEAGQLSHDTVQDAGAPYWTSTAFKGRHTMVCEVLKDGTVVRRAEHIVRIGPGRWLR
jgi:hypothetical protein